MKVLEFSSAKGIYIFEFDELDTELHSHPAIEIVIASTGEFTLRTENETHEHLKFAVIPANRKHLISSANCELKVIMLEHHNKKVYSSLTIAGADSSRVCFSTSLPADSVMTQIEKLVSVLDAGQKADEYDYRIVKTLEYMNEHNLEYNSMMNILQMLTNLSESRLSHLFKSNVGISLKKYLVWTKLKSTIETHLNSKDDLFTALVKSGFYDQPHFSRSFKNMLGVKPSKPYRSRNIQVLSDPRR